MNYIKPYNFYDKLKAKNKKYVTNKTYFDMIISCVSSSFIYEYNERNGVTAKVQSLTARAASVA